MTPGHWGPILASNQGLRVINCEVCGYAHLELLPEASERAHYYSHDYYDDPDNVNFLIKEAWEHKQGLWNAAYADQMQLLDNNLPIIDAGCGAGWFIGYSWYHNRPAYGIEPSQRVRQFSQVGTYVYPDLHALWLTTIPGQPLNVRASLVLEHILHPDEFLCDYKRLLSRLGRFLVIVPNDFSPLQAKLRTRHFIEPDHINYWTPKTLWRLLDRNGFKTVAQSATFPTELFKLIFGQDYINHPEIGRRCHLHRLHFEQRLGPYAFRFYRLLYRKLGWSRELVFAAEKKHVDEERFG